MYNKMPKAQREAGTGLGSQGERRTAKRGLVSKIETKKKATQLRAASGVK